MEIIRRQRVLATLAAVSICLGLVLLICLSILPTFSFGDATATTKVTFVNKVPGTALGLVVFATDEDNNITDYLPIAIWNTEKEVLDLITGCLYGVTHFDPYYDRVIDFKTFYVHETPITVTFGQ